MKKRSVVIKFFVPIPTVVIINLIDRLIEHNLDIIKQADWIIDLGPEGGEKGRKVIAQGTPRQISNNPNSYTGRYLKKILLTLNHYFVYSNNRSGILFTSK